MSDIWNDDRLGYRDIALSFTNLIKSINDSKVLSIEAGFGRGKTFFRKAWAGHLEQQGEVVVEIDVLQSDHSGDPLITLLGALVEKLPKKSKGKAEAALSSAKRLGALGARTVAKAVLRSGADEVIDALSAKAIDSLSDFEALADLINEVGDEMSKAAEQLIMTQMAAEKVRKEELPEQLRNLREEITKHFDNSRIVIIIDELDRCHPEYTISFLEAIKSIFNQEGFIFCLMINPNYLEKIAEKRFGASTEDEKYLDKFVDIRLRLEPKLEKLKDAAYNLTLELPAANPYADTPEFALTHAAQLAGELSTHTRLSLRIIKRIILKVELALRCYSDRPLDTSLLIFLAFQDESPIAIGNSFLPRSFLTAEEGQTRLANYEQVSSLASRDAERMQYDMTKKIKETAPELLELPKERYRAPDQRNYHGWASVFAHLAPHYIPSHREVLNAVAELVPVPAKD